MTAHVYLENMRSLQKYFIDLIIFSQKYFVLFIFVNSSQRQTFLYSELFQSYGVTFFTQGIATTITKNE